MEAIRCPRCSAPVGPAQRFCGSCGSPLGLRCGACGAENDPTFRFCGHCGTSLSPSGSATSQAHAGVVRPAVESGPEERRWATVLFADLVGFTGMSERLDPEEVRSLVDGCMAEMAAVVAPYEGAVERVTGDELMVVFGAPVAHEDDPERAVRAALDLVACAHEHADEFAGLALRVGVNTGEVMFAPVGPAGARQMTVMGDVVNTASRLQTNAPPGGILVGEETYLATRRVVRYEALEPFRAKGKEAPLTAWRPLEVPVAPSVRPLSSMPLVGREAELDELWRTWERVVIGRRPHLVTVVGPPGIGKTRLARELVAKVEEEGGRCLAGRSLPYGERTGYGAFGEQVKRLAGILETDPAPDARAKLASVCAGLLVGDRDEAGRLASHVATLTGFGGDADSVPEKGPLLYAARRFVEAVAAETPTVFLFEDVHWADPSLLELIASLAGWARDTPALFVTLARPELLDARPGWGGGLASYSALVLDPLPDAGARSLAAALAPHLSAEAAGRLAETAGGNPLFIEELAASVSEAAAELLGALPTTVKATIAARLDALPPDERAILLDASVVGKIFWRGALEFVRGGDREAVAGFLDSLERRDFIRREPSCRFAGDAEFSFRHMLIRDVAYATLPKATRRRRHAAVAGFLEEAAGERVAESASLLAHHWAEAGEDDRALEYLIQAAGHARRTWATAEAVRLYDQALELLAASEGVNGDRHRTISMERALALSEGGDIANAAPELDRLLPRLSGRARCEVLFHRAVGAFYMTDIEAQRRAGAEAIALAEELDDDEYRRLGLMLRVQEGVLAGGLTASMPAGERALAAWPEGERGPERSLLLSLMSLNHYWLGQCQAAFERSSLAWKLASEANSQNAFLFSSPHLGLALAGLGRHGEAIAHLEWTLARGRDVEYVPRMTSRCAGMCSGVLHDVFDSAQARELSAETVELSAAGGFPASGLFARMDLLAADAADRDYGAVETAWALLWDDIAGLRGWHEWLARGRLLQSRAEFVVATGTPDDATKAAEESLAWWRRYERPRYVAAALAALGRAHLAAGRAEDGLAALAEARSVAERLASPSVTWRVLAAVVDGLVATGDDNAAALAHAELAAAVQGIAAGLTEGRRARFLGAPAVAAALAAGG